MEKYWTADGRKKFTIKPFEEELSFDKVGGGCLVVLSFVSQGLFRVHPCNSTADESQ